MRQSLVVLFSLLLPLPAIPAIAADAVQEEARAAVSEGFSALERSIIARYYGGGGGDASTPTATEQADGAWRRLGDADDGKPADGTRDRRSRYDEDDDRDGQDDGAGGKSGKKDKKGKQGGKKMPPGLAKRDTLPPGLAKRDTLPPGLAKRELPQDLDAKLPPVGEGLERVVVDRSVILVDKATGVVRDILRDVIN